MSVDLTFYGDLGELTDPKFKKKVREEEEKFMAVAKQVLGDNAVFSIVYNDNGGLSFWEAEERDEVWNGIMQWLIKDCCATPQRELAELTLRNWWSILADELDETLGEIDEEKYAELQKMVLSSAAEQLEKGDIDQELLYLANKRFSTEKIDFPKGGVAEMKAYIEEYRKKERAREKVNSDLSDRLKESEEFCERLKEKHKKEIADKDKRIRELIKEIKTLEHKSDKTGKAQTKQTEIKIVSKTDYEYIEEIETEIERLRAENMAYEEHAIAMREEANLFAEFDNEEVQCDLYGKLFSKRMIFVGGHIGTIDKLKELFPNARFVDTHRKDKLNLSAKDVKSYGCIVYFTRFLSHTEFQRVRSIYKGKQDVVEIMVNQSGVNAALKTISDYFK